MQSLAAFPQSSVSGYQAERRTTQLKVNLISIASRIFFSGQLPGHNYRLIFLSATLGYIYARHQTNPSRLGGQQNNAQIPSSPLPKPGKTPPQAASTTMARQIRYPWLPRPTTLGTHPSSSTTRALLDSHASAPCHPRNHTQRI